MNLNVGSGYLALEGFINLDNSLFLKLSRSPFYAVLKPFLSNEKQKVVKQFIEVSQRADLRRYDCRKKMPFDSGSISHILCSHFLEHLFHDQSMFLLTEFYRVLKSGGTAHIVLPDLEEHVNTYLADQRPEAADAFMERILQYGKQGLTARNKLLDLTGNYGLHHLWMYDRRSMEHKMRQAGFVIDNSLVTPSAEFRKNDGSLHIVAMKK